MLTVAAYFDATDAASSAGRTVRVSVLTGGKVLRGEGAVKVQPISGGTICGRCTHENICCN